MIETRHVGFAGSTEGLTEAQHQTLKIALGKSQGWFHHCDGINGDEQAHELAIKLGYKVLIHPPDNKKLRGFSETHPGWMFIPNKRQLAIQLMIENAKRIIIAPTEAEEEEGLGVWTAVRMARRRGFPVKIILPNGKVRNERW